MLRSRPGLNTVVALALMLVLIECGSAGAREGSLPAPASTVSGTASTFEGRPYLVMHYLEPARPEDAMTFYYHSSPVGSHWPSSQSTWL